jgi:hypothetical protein
MAIEEGRLGSTGSASTARQRWVAVLRSYVATVAIGNFVWEVAHLPLYTIWRTGTTGENAFAVVHCTVGDVVLASGIFAVALLIAGNRDLPVHDFWRVAILTVLLGIGATMLLEWLNVVIWRSWAYSSLMPVLPIFGFDVGLSPLLQWIVVPLLALWRAGRHRGAETS